MKCKLSSILILFVCLSLALPSLAYSRRYYGNYRGCYGCGYYRSSDYWVPAAVMAGTILVGAAVIGAMAQTPRQPNPPQQTPYRVLDTGRPYAAPDPDFVARYEKKANSPGEWVIVPAQQVGTVWVPAHRVFVTDR